MKTNIKKSDINLFIFVFICLVPYLLPASYILGDILNSFANLWLRFTWLIALFLLVIKHKINKIDIIFILFQFVFVIATILNTKYGQISGAFYLFANNCSFIILLNYFIKKDNKKTIKYIKHIYLIMILINFITMFIYYPSGMYKDILGDHNYYFLEHDNGSFFYTLPVLLLIIFDDIRNYNKLKISSIILILISFLAYFYVSSITSYVCILLIIFLLIFSNNKTVKKLVNSNLFYILFIIFMLLLLTFNGNNKIYVKAITFFNKDMTLSGRTILWAKALKYIKLNSIIGYGNEFLNVRLMKFGISHIHNILLQILYNGGILAISLFVYYIHIINSKLNKFKNDNKLVYIIKVFIYIYLIASAFDYYNTKYIVNIIFVLATNINLFIKKEDDNI